MVQRASKGRFHSYASFDREGLFSKGAILCLMAIIGFAIAFLPLTIASALVLGSAVVLATLIRPEYGLYFLIFSIPFASIRELQIGPVTVGATEALVVLVLCTWLAKMIATREIEIAQPPLSLHLLLFLGAALLSLTVALSLTMSLKEIMKWLSLLGIYLFVANTVDKRQAKSIIALIISAGISQALLGFYQFFSRIGPEGFIIFGRFIRAYGSFAQPNPYGGYLGLVLPLAYSIFVQGTRHKAQGVRLETSLPLAPCPLPLWLLSGFGFLLMGTAMLMSWSRGAWLGFAAAFVVMNFVRSRRAMAFFAIALLLGALLLLLGGLQLIPAVLVKRFTEFLPYLGLFDIRGIEVTPENWPIVERMAHWQAGWYMFTDHPWLGVGIGNYASAYPAHALPGWDNPLGHAHNYYLNIAAEGGLVGLCTYLFFVGACFWQAWRAVRCTKGCWQGAAMGILGILTHLSVHNLFDNLYVHGMNVHVGILLGLLAVIRAREQ